MLFVCSTRVVSSLLNRPSPHSFGTSPPEASIHLSLISPRSKRKRIACLPGERCQALIYGKEYQESLFRVVASLARDLLLPTQPKTTTRYGSENTNFGIGDALVLAGMLRHLCPSHYLEVGSGFTTALAVDINEMFLDGSMTITAIEPYPDLLKSLLRPTDSIDILPHPVQSVSLERFAELQPNDVLFIDSSHMLKTGSDVHFLIASVLPVIREGVYVHFHDVFWPFEYPRDWIEDGRAWNEDYLLHAFLLYNDVFKIVLWNHWVGVNRPNLIAQELPAMLENIGGSLWLRRTK